MASNSDQFPDSKEPRDKFHLGREARRIGEGISKCVKEHEGEIRRIIELEEHRKSEVDIIRDERFKDESNVPEPNNIEAYRDRMRRCFVSGRRFETLLRERKLAKSEEAVANDQLVDGIIRVLGPQVVHEKLKTFMARQHDIAAPPTVEPNRGVKRSIEDMPDRSSKGPRMDAEEGASKLPQDNALIVVPE